MKLHTKSFMDEGWGIWIDGDDRSVVYLNEWVNPKGNSYTDVAVRIYGVQNAKDVCIYIPSRVSQEEIENLYENLLDGAALTGIFNSSCTIDKKTNNYSTGVHYNNKDVSIIHLHGDYAKTEEASGGTLLTMELEKIKEYIAYNEGYIVFRVPNKGLNCMFSRKTDLRDISARFKELISSPVTNEKYGYSIRINEARLLPEKYRKSPVLQQQRIRKAVVTITINEDYELDEYDCYRIRQLENMLYENYSPADFECDGAIVYQWVKERARGMKSHYSFYFKLSYSDISYRSLLIYVILIIITAVAANIAFDFLKIVFPFL